MKLALTEEWKKKRLEGYKKFLNSERFKLRNEKISISLKGRHCTPLTEFKKGHKVPNGWRESYRKKLYERLKDDEYRINFNKKRFSACGMKPNKKELVLNKILQKNFPNEWKYVGNGEVVLGAGCPDFINCNGQKKVILFHGLYWHLWRLQRENSNLTKEIIEQNDKKNYKKYGFECLIIWEDELKNLDFVIGKVSSFTQTKADFK
jgi:G:T-mismatch repair DNA endonuclease (very short patch repair protein)